MPAVGFGFGDAVIEALLEDEGCGPRCPRALDAVVFPFGEAERAGRDPRWRSALRAARRVGGARARRR